MAIDKELFYASHGQYPVVARPYTNDMEVKEKFYTKDEVIAMLTEIQLEIEENSYSENVYGDEYSINKVISIDDIYQIIQQKINVLKAERKG